MSRLITYRSISGVMIDWRLEFLLECFRPSRKRRRNFLQKVGSEKSALLIELEIMRKLYLAKRRGKRWTISRIVRRQLERAPGWLKEIMNGLYADEDGIWTVSELKYAQVFAALTAKTFPEILQEGRAKRSYELSLVDKAIGEYVFSIEWLHFQIEQVRENPHLLRSGKRLLFQGRC
jgi:hypothetical protein